MKKLLVWLIVIIGLLAIIYSKNGEIPILSDYGILGEDRLPNMPHKYDDHIYLGYRSRGASKSFTGDIAITVVFVDDAKAKWSDADRATFKKTQDEEIEKLLKDAEGYGAELDITMNYLNSKSDDIVQYGDYKDWVKETINELDWPKENKISKMLKNKYGAKEAPVVFAVNYTGRSFAVQGGDTNSFEYVVLFKEHKSICHELYHVFGARDYYYPESVKAIGEKYFPDSTMLKSGEIVTDSLTAYLIGWTDTPSKEALAFLDETKHITQKSISEEQKKETITGYGTTRIGEGTYTGYLTAGLANGKGKIVWDSGNVYEGDWVNGHISGKGTMIWKESGDTYTGDWLNGKRHGKGKFVWKSGNVYEGDWVNSKREGKGKLVWKNGDSYEGDWKDDVATGKGTLIWKKNGTSYTGDWVNWKKHGYGVYTYRDGTTLTGNWQNDKFIK